MAKVATLKIAQQTRSQPSAPKGDDTKPMVRTGEGLRDVLFDEIDKLRAGTGDRRRALTIASLATQIINTAKVEIEFQRHMALLGREGQTSESGLPKLGLLQLGTPTDSDN
jgi:hypothetical protein